VSSSTSSRALTPSMVLSRTGHRQPDTITSTFMVVPMPATRMKIGTSTGGGMARRNSSTGSRAARRPREDPTSTPRATPATVARANPASSRATLGSTSSASRPPSQVSAKAARMSRSGGR
jgi:hypothetical protein